MPPKRTRNHKSNDTTPSESAQRERSPVKVTYSQNSPKILSGNRCQKSVKKIELSQAQKRALIQNLQLEITERARRLRAQYALQAKGLRTRVEIRINRIPVAVRRLKMGDLLLKYSEKPMEDKVSQSKTDLKSLERIPPQTLSIASLLPPRGTKRTRLGILQLYLGFANTISDAISIDQENSNSIENNSKRSRRYAPRVPASQVLSPRSANSHIVPKTTVRRVSPVKQAFARYISPQKPNSKVISGKSSGILKSITSKVETRNDLKATQKTEVESSVVAGRGRRFPPSSKAQKLGRGRTSIVSQASDSSSSTVRKMAPTRKAPMREKQTQIKRGVLGAIKGIGSQKKAPADEKNSDMSHTFGGRVLRKRK
ncbi:hypothetical protein OnM2_045009 [Erysiphe neolycopersici]|uniref:Borealin N-terminal domain-containing protein n=1 Tax=Erysiphe neolycopersici TaxID=212602 RepID=A0A420HUG7_9PEZI|nr:hypothetical protein OnM2_045009 [Erysiphe neolycopersici]